ncbi:putative toxin [Fusobacterium sp.]|uniref:putative toxin n=1 Tax=Fusobacterium sp. TaxID=68766 RepID=UPI0025C3699C|nr:putative toxin [Fusobacterium sp.]MCI7223121.1 putative toxin [Fusobacterium sp.]
MGIDIKVNYTDTKGMPLESKDKGGTARLDGTNGEIYINTDRIKNTSELVGTVFEELSHIIDGVAGRQDKEVAETTDEKGLESLGRPVNDYFVETYKEDSKEISLVSDKKDYTNAGGVNVGDFDPISAGTVYISTLLSSSDLELDLMSLADSGSELVANPSLGTGAVFAIDLIGTALPGVQATVIRRGGEVLLKAVDGTVYKVVGKSADEILKIIGDTSVGKKTVKLADDVLEKLSSVINKVDSKIDDALGLTVKNADSSVTKVGVEVVENNITSNSSNNISFNKLEEARVKGKQGELDAGIDLNVKKETIPSLTKTAEYRVPDELLKDQKFMREIKNVKKQSYTNQIKDMNLWAEQNGYTFQLEVRPNTRLTKPLLKEIENGNIILKYIGDKK